MAMRRMLVVIAMLLLAFEGVVARGVVEKEWVAKEKAAAANKEEEAAAKKATADKAAAAKKAAADKEDAAAKKATADKAAAAKKLADEAAAQKADADKAAAEKADADKAAAAKKLADEAAAQKADADKAAAEKADADKAAAVKADKAAAAVAAVKAAHEAAVAQKAAAADQAAAAAAAAAAKKAAAEKSAAEKPAAPVTRHLVLAVADVGAFMDDPSVAVLTKAIAGSLGVTTGQVQDVRITQAAAPTLSGTRLRRLMAGSVDVAFTCVNCQQGSCTETGLVSALNAAGAPEVISATCLPEEPNPCARVISTITTTPAPVQAPCTTVAPVVVSADPCAAQAKKFSQNAGGAKRSPIATWSPSMLWLAVPSLLGMIFLVRGVSTARCGVPEPCRGEEARSLTTLLEEVPLSERVYQGVNTRRAQKREPTELEEAVEFLE